MELTLLAAALTGVGAMWITNRILAPRIDVSRPTDILVGAALSGLVVGRLAAMVAAGTNPLLRPGDIIVVRGGVATQYAAVAAVTALGWATRRHLPNAAAQLAPAALAGLAGWHGGCAWRGSCLGVAGDVPWALAAPGSEVTRHPVELYAAIAFVLAAFVAVRFMHRGWVGVGWAVMAAGAVRLATEPLRVSIVGGPVWWYGIAIVAGFGLMSVGFAQSTAAPPVT